MRTTTIPAQITSVEDKVAGKLTLQQLIILLTALLLDFAVFALFPKEMRMSILKVILSFILTLTICVQAIKIKETIVFFWLLKIAKYIFRPRYFVFNKNDTNLRDLKTSNAEVEAEQLSQSPLVLTYSVKQIPLKDELRIFNLINQNLIELSFKKHRGGMGVYVSENRK